MRYLKQPIVIALLAIVAAYLIWQYGFKKDTKPAAPQSGTAPGSTSAPNTDSAKNGIRSFSGPVVTYR